MEDRQRGYLEAMVARGLSVDERYIRSADPTIDNGKQEALGLFKISPRPTAIFAASVMLAVGVLSAARNAGLSVPGDVSVVGFDGIEEGVYHIPSLASMKQPQAEMAHDSVRILLGHIRGGAPHKHLMFSAELTGGESFAPFAE